jgi:hypothetical protein
VRPRPDASLRRGSVRLHPQGASTRPAAVCPEQRRFRSAVILHSLPDSSLRRAIDPP